MPAQFTASRLSFTATATSSKTDFPASNLNVVGAHPLIYSWRSNNQVTQQDLICDLGSSKSLASVAVLHVNASSIQIAFSTDNVSYTNFTGSPFTVIQEPYGVYRKRRIIQTVTARYVRVRIPAQTPVDGAAYFEVGLIWITDALTTFPYGPKTGARTTLRRDSLRTGHDVAALGPWFGSEEWEMTVPIAQHSTYAQFARNGPDTPILIYKSDLSGDELGIYRFADVVTFERQAKIENVNPRLEELV
jgi:hypothetical protein